MADPALDIPRMSAAEYLQMEKQATWKHEFVNGVVYARAGASRRHNTIAQNVSRALGDRLSPPCQIYSLEVKVHRLSASEKQFYYPDGVVTCSDLDTDEDLVKFPSLVVEVISKSTESADRGYKFDDYKKLLSVQEYVLVHQSRACVEVYRRRTEWLKEVFETDATITLKSVQVTVPVAAFYQRVTLAAAGDS